MKRSIQSVVAEKILAGTSKKRLSLFLYDAKSELDLAKKHKEKPFKLSKIRMKKLNLQEKKYKNTPYYVFPNNKNTKTTIIYIHGGAYLNQPLLFHWNYLDRLHNLYPAKIIVPIYPKAPFHFMEEAMDDMLGIYKKILKTTSPRNIVLMGDSSGGGFALALTMRLKKEKLPEPRAQILFSPWLDIEMKNKEMRQIQKKDPMLNIESLREIGECYAGRLPFNDYQISPINGDFAGLAPISLFVGTREIFLPDCRLLRVLTMNEGININYFEYEGMNHVFPLYPIPEAYDALNKVIEILKVSSMH